MGMVLVVRPLCNYSSCSLSLLKQCYNTNFVLHYLGNAFEVPAAAGFPVGRGQSNNFVMQIHYNNPRHLTNSQDNSGIRFSYTSKLRPHDADFMVLGLSSSSYLRIPPRQEAFEVTDVCASSCTEQAQTFYAFATLLHMHTLGKKMQTEHFRPIRKNIANGKALYSYYKVGDLARNDQYDFNRQETDKLTTPVAIQPGDMLITRCTFNSMNKNVTTVGGMSTSNEMCYNFVAYYPKKDGVYTCASHDGCTTPASSAQKNTPPNPFTDILPASLAMGMLVLAVIVAVAIAGAVVLVMRVFSGQNHHQGRSAI